MNAWVLRAVTLGGCVVAARVVLGFVMLQWPTHSTAPSVLLFLLVLATAGWWGYSDGRKDRAAYPDPEDGNDLTLLWLGAAAVAGVGSGALSWLIGLLPSVEVGGTSLIFELTSGAAFIILVIFLPALLGITVGRFRVDRAARKSTPVSSQALS